MNSFVLRTWLEARLGRDERGASLVEYVFLIVLIAVAVIGAVMFLRGELTGKFNEAGSRVSETPY